MTNPRRAPTFLLLLLLISIAIPRRVPKHLDISSGMFKDLIGGDISGFVRRAALSQSTEGMSDRLGVNNLLGGSETGQGSSYKLSGLLASGWHSKDALGSL